MKRLADGHVANDLSRYCFSSRLQTIRHPMLTVLERRWYRRDKDGVYVYDTSGKRVKQIPDVILTPLVVAIWHMDDGHNSQTHKTCHLFTNAFAPEEVETLTCQLGNGF